MISDTLRHCLRLIPILDDVALMAVFLALMGTVAAARNISLLATFSALNIAYGVLLGRTTLNVAGLNFSTGAMFLASAMFGIALKHRVYGKAEASRAAKNILLALIIVFGAVFLLNQIELINPLFDASIRKATVRFICFYFAQSLLIHMLDRSSVVSPMVRIPAIIMLVESLEGIVFYPCVLLGDRLPDMVFEFTISSIVIRLLTTLIAVPFLAAFLLLERRGLTPMQRQTPLAG